MSFVAALLLFLFPAAAGISSDVLLVVDRNVVRIFDAKTGEQRSEARIGEGVHEIEVLADRTTAVLSNYGTPQQPGRTVTLLDVDRGTLLGTIDLGQGTMPRGLTSLPNGRFLVAAEGKKELLVVDSVERRVITRIPLGRDGYHMVVATPDGSRAFVASSRAGLVTAVNLSPVRILRDIVTGPGPVGMDVTPDGKSVWVTGPASDSVWLIDAVDPGIFPRIPVPTFPNRVRITPDGRYALVSCTRSGEVAVFDAATRREIKRISVVRSAVLAEGAHVARGGIPHLPGPTHLVVEPNGRYVWVSFQGSNAVCRFDLETVTLSRTLLVSSEPGALAGRFPR